MEIENLWRQCQNLNQGALRVMSDSMADSTTNTKWKSYSLLYSYGRHYLYKGELYMFRQLLTW